MALTAAELVGYLTLDDSDYDSGLRRAEGKAQTASQRIGSALGTAGKALSTAATLTATTVGGLIVSATRAGAAYNGMQQASRAALSTMLGGAREANAQMDKLDDFARNSPFAKQVFIKAQQQLLGFGVEAERVVPTLDAVQNAVAAVGGSNEDITRIVDSLAKMKGQGKLTGETLNELGQYGINAADLIGKQMGKSGAEIRDMASKPGGIPADQVFDVLTTAMTAKFGGAADNVKKTWVGATDRIRGAWRDIGSDLAEPFVGHKGGGLAIEWVNKFADLMRALQSQIEPVVTLLVDRFQPGLEKVSPTLDKITQAVKNFDPTKLDEFMDDMSGFAPIVTGVSTAIGALGTNNIPILGRLGFAINPFAAGLAAAAAASPELRAAAGDLLRALAPLLPVVGDMGADLANALAPGFEVVADTAGPVIDIIARVVDAFAGLPTPIQNAVTAFVGLKIIKGHIGGVADAVTGRLSSAVKTGSGLLDTLRLNFMYAGDAARDAGGGIKGFTSGVRVGLAGALKSVGGMLLRGGLWGLAIAGATTAIGYFAKKHEEAQRAAEQTRQNVKELTDTLDENTGSITKNTDEWIKNKLQAEGLVDKARKLGVPYEALFKAARNGGKDLRALNEMIYAQAGYADVANESAYGMVRAYQDLSPEAKELLEAISGQNGELATARENWKYMNEATDVAAESTGNAADKQKQMRTATQNAGNAVEETGRKAKKAAPDIRLFGQDITKSGDKAKGAKIDVNAFADAIRGLHQPYLDARAASRDFQQAIDDLAAGVKENGRTLDENTDAGRKNAANLDNIASTGKRVVASLVDRHASEKKVRDAIRDTNSALRDAGKRLGLTGKDLDNYVKHAGFSRDATQQVIDKMRKLAQEKPQPELKPLGFREARTQIADVMRDLDRLDRKRARPSVKVVGIAAAASDIGSIISRIDDLDGKHATSTVTTKRITEYATTGRQLGGPWQVPGHATGTIAARAGYAWVGERGPELVRFRGGEQVVPSAQSQALAAGSSSHDNRVTINHYGDIRANDPDDYQRAMEKKQRLAALGAMG